MRARSVLLIALVTAIVSGCGSNGRSVLAQGVAFNTLNGRPARALAAYDGPLNHIKPLAA